MYTPEPNTGCWLWLGVIQRDGYGVYGRRELAHRAAQRIHCGPPPPGAYVLHRCDVRHCVNPDHLFLGGHQDNMDDMAKKGRRAIISKPGESNGSAKLTAPDVVRIREMLAAGVARSRVATAFGVTYSNVRMIHRGQTWAGVGAPTGGT